MIEVYPPAFLDGTTLSKNFPRTLIIRKPVFGVFYYDFNTLPQSEDVTALAQKASVTGPAVFLFSRIITTEVEKIGTDDNILVQGWAVVEKPASLTIKEGFPSKWHVLSGLPQSCCLMSGEQLKAKPKGADIMLSVMFPDKVKNTFGLPLSLLQLNLPSLEGKILEDYAEIR